MVIAQLAGGLALAEAGSLLLAKNLYLPLQIGLPLTTFVVPIMLLMPETLPHTTSSLGSQQRLSIVGDRHLFEHPVNLNATEILREPRRITRVWFWTCIKNLHALRSLSGSPSVKNLKILIIFTIFFAGVLDQGTFAHALQYISKKFGWTIAEAGKLIPVASVFKLAILLCVIPQIVLFLRRLVWTNESIDACIVIIGLIGITIGNFVVAVCSNWQEFAAGKL